MTSHRLWVAQSAEYAELASILTRPGPGGALILGGFGIGKTTLVRAVLARRDVPAPAMRVHCSPTLAREPCGALSPYLSTPAPADSPAQVIREISAVLEAEQTSGTIPIVIVEDAEHLDDETSFVLSTLVENAAIKLVAIGHGGADGESTLYSLTESGLLTTLVVQPLDRAGVRFLAEELAGGVFTAIAVDIMTAMTGGNPSFVEAFVRSCLDQDLIVRSSADDGGLLTLARLDPEPDEPLMELVRDVTRSLSVDHRMVLEILALAGPQSGPVLSAASGGEHRRLIEAGILTTGADGLVRIASEIHGHVLRSIVPPGRSAQLYATWSEHRAREVQPTSLEVLWALEVDADVPSDLVLAAIEDADMGFDFRLAWRLIDARATTDSDSATLLRARTLIGLGRHYSARTLLMRVAETSTDPATRQEALTLLLTAFDQIGTDTADIAAFERWWAEQARSPGKGEALTAGAGRRREDVRRPAQTGRGVGTAPRSIAEVERILSSPDLSADGRILALTDLTDLHSVAGRTDTALEIARTALVGLTDERMAADYELLVLVRIGWNLIFSGRYSEAEALLAHARGATLHIALHRAGALGVLRSLLELAQGQTGRAQRTLDEAVAELRLRDTVQMLPSALALRMLTSPPADRVPGDRALIDILSSAGSGRAQEPRRILARAALAAARGESPAEYPLFEREMLAADSEQIVGVSGRGARRRLTELAGTAEGSRAALLARLAHVLDDPSPEAAEHVARDAGATGDWGIAAQALARAAFLWSAVGDVRRCGIAVRKLKALIRSRDVTPGEYAARALAMAELTGREEEIVRLTRSGKSNADIARALTVSQRTVEGHLYRIFAKLGIADRSELASPEFDPGTAVV